jgi:hypothetical protein
MSRYSYAGEFKNPAESYFVKEVELYDGDDSETTEFQIWVKESRRCDCGCPNCTAMIEEERPTRPLQKFPTHEDAVDSIEATEEFFERDYEEYQEENHYEIAQMERYEAFRREY